MFYHNFTKTHRFELLSIDTGPRLQHIGIMLKLQQAAEEAATAMRGPIRGGKYRLDGGGKKTRKHHLARARNAAFLWFFHKGWEGEAIADHLDCGAASYYRFMAKLREAPWLLFNYPVLTRGARGLVVIWTCEVCGGKFPKLSERKAREHVAFHFLPRTTVISLGVFGEWYE